MDDLGAPFDRYVESGNSPDRPIKYGAGAGAGGYSSSAKKNENNGYGWSSNVNEKKHTIKVLEHESKIFNFEKRVDGQIRPSIR